MVLQTDKVIERIKSLYPTGTRIKLLDMNDIQSPPIGTLGTVKGVDSAGNILMSWDTGSRLNLIYGVDQFEVIK